MKKIFSLILKVLGFVFISAALLGAFGTASAYIARAKHGTGLLFADAEIFILLTVVFTMLGITSFWIGEKIKK
jgi:hypothetical protein